MGPRFRRVDGARTARRRTLIVLVEAGGAALGALGRVMRTGQPIHQSARATHQGACASCPASWLLAASTSRASVSNIAGAAWSAAVRNTGEDSTVALGDRVWSGRASDVPGGHRRARRRGNVGPAELPRMEARRLVARRCDRGTGRTDARAGTRVRQRRRLAPPRCISRDAPEPFARSLRATAAQPSWTQVTHDPPGLQAPRVPPVRVLARARASIARASVLSRARRRSAGDAGASAA